MECTEEAPPSRRRPGATSGSDYGSDDDLERAIATSKARQTALNLVQGGLVNLYTRVANWHIKDDDDDVHSAPCSLQPIGVGHTGSCLYEAMLRLIEFSDWEMPPS